MWEETIILLPDNVHYVFLSATIHNARQFAEWICHLHKQVRLHSPLMCIPETVDLSDDNCFSLPSPSPLPPRLSSHAPLPRPPSQPCHVVYTDYRPVPLQHYIYPAGADGLYLVVDEKVRSLDLSCESLPSTSSSSDLSVTSGRTTSRVPWRCWRTAEPGRNSGEGGREEPRELPPPSRYLRSFGMSLGSRVQS